MKNKYYRKLDIIRIISCIGVLLYHLNILKGGFLAVCSFFVLTGYLSYKSAEKEKKFSIKKYYLSRLKNIYYPLIIVVFLTITLVLLFTKTNWLNLKPETLSILLGYNNFWQLNANLDYFTRHISSPFMHFWYIAILLQFELIFPFIFLLIKKIREKTHKIIPLIILLLLSITTTIIPILYIKNIGIMQLYYNTLYRVFSIILGLLLGYISCHYEIKIMKKLENSIIKDIIFYFYLIIDIYLMFIINSNSKWLIESMILTSLITCRMIRYGTLKESKVNKIISYLSKNTYEIYLVQYPIIFFIQELKISQVLKNSLIITITLIISFLLYKILHSKIKKHKIIIWILRIPIFIICFYGAFQFVIAKDHTKEMKLLEEDLKKNQELMKKQQEEYKKRMKEQEDSWNQKMEEFLKNEDSLKETVRNLNIVGVGDSVMLGALPSLKEQFPNGYFDAGVSRTDWEANKILLGMKSQGILGEPVIINLGTNGQCGENCRNEILNTLENRKIFWVNVTNDYEVHVNSSIENFANTHDNVYQIDWNEASKNHKEYFVADGIHLTSIGMRAYSEVIYQAIYKVYYEEFQKEKEKQLKEHEESQLEGYSFFGNDLLLNIIDNLSEIDNKDINVKNDYNLEKIIKDIEDKKKENQLKNHIIFLFDKTFTIRQKDYEKIIKLLENKKIYIIQLINNNLSFNQDNVITIPFYKDMKEDYLLPDKIHLTNKGNKELEKIIKSIK
ncbi:MAG: acyltransferase family protein [Bacilli bacterium]|nr:acyltransferase family protein [Bacilli bacterium]